MIYKQAGAQFENEEFLRARITELSEAIFADHISELSQVHAELVENPNINLLDAIKTQTFDQHFQKSLYEIISNIGFNNFVNTEFGYVAEALRQLRAAAPVAEAPQGDSLQEALGNILADLKEQYQHYYGLEYPGVKSQYQRKLLSNMLMEFKAAISWLASGQISEANIASTLDRVASIKKWLDAWAAGLSEPPTDTKSETETSGDEPREGPSPEDVREEEGDAVSDEKEKYDAKVEITPEEAVNHPIFGDINNYIDFEQVPPVINESEFAKLEKRFANEIKNKYAAAAHEARGSGAKASRNLRLEFNNLLFSVKAFDKLLLSKLKEQRNDLGGGYNILYNRLLQSLLSYKISQNANRITNTLYLPIIFFKSHKLWKILSSELYAKKFLSVFSAKRGLDSIVKDEGFVSPARFSEVALDFAMEELVNIVAHIMNPENNVDASNVLRDVSINPNIPYDRASRELLGDLPRVQRAWCTVCYKVIDLFHEEKAKELDSSLGGFELPIFSLFRVVKTQGRRDEVYLIGEEDFIYDIDPETGRKIKRGPFDPPDPKYYKDDKKTIADYEGQKTWEEIKSMITSDNLTVHRQGLQWRSAAFQQVGAEYITTKEISRFMQKCPFGSKDLEGNRKSACGVSFSPPAAGAVSMNNLQPQWNGRFDEHFIWNPAEEAEWKKHHGDEKMMKALEAKAYGGYKFSSATFACPCRITDIDAKTQRKHSTLAIPLSGINSWEKGTEPPTTPQGNLDIDIVRAADTIGYLVCGASTSLSAFDRDPNSPNYILKTMQRILDKDVKLFRKLVDRLLLHGVDMNDMLVVVNMMKHLKGGGNPENNPKRAARVEQLSQIISTAGINVSEFYDVLEDVGLVCPFGHKFTIGQSLKFGSTHTGLSVKNRIFDRFAEVLRTTGVQNLKEANAAGTFISVDKYPFVKYMDPQETYGEFLDRYGLDDNVLLAAAVPEGKIVRRSQAEELIRTWRQYTWADLPTHAKLITPTKSKTEKKINMPCLAYIFPDKNGDLARFFLSPSLKFKKGLWPGMTSLHEPALEQKRYVTFFTQVDQYSIGAEEGEGFDLGEIKMAQEDFLKRQDQFYNQEPIPGTDAEGSLQSKVASLSRLIKSMFEISMAWTNQVVSYNFANALLSDFQTDLSKHGLTLAGLLDKEIIVYSPITGAIEAEQGSIAAVKQQFADNISEVLQRKVENLARWVTSKLFTADKLKVKNELAAEIIFAALSEAYEDTREATDFALEIDVDDIDEYLMGKASQYTRGKATKDVVDVILYDTKEFKKINDLRARYASQIFLVSYAQTIQKSLVEIYRRYFTENNPTYYVGYDIGLDFSSIEKVRAITPDDLTGIISQVGHENINVSRGGSLSVEERIDWVYAQAQRDLQNSRRLSLSPAALQSAKEYIIDTLVDKFDLDPGFTREGIGKAFPIRTHGFNTDIENPQNEIKSLPHNFIPYAAAEKSLLNLPDTVSVRAFVVEDGLHTQYKNLENPRKLFIADDASGEAAERAKSEAEAFLAQLQAENPEDVWRAQFRKDFGYEIRRAFVRFKIIPITIFKNDSHNWDSSRYQLGMIGAKPPSTALTWPPATTGYVTHGQKGAEGFVGMVLPFKLKEGEKPSWSHLRNIQLVNPSIIVNIDGVPTDISFLFQRGRSEADFNRIKNLEEEIEKLDELDENYSIELIRLQEEIASIPFRIRTHRAIMEYSQRAGAWEPVARPAIVLTDAARAYELIMDDNKSGYQRNPDMTEEAYQARRQRLLGFLLDVYSLRKVKNVVADITGKSRENFSIHEFFSTPLSAEESSQVGKILQKEDDTGWRNDIGQYYDVIPATEGYVSGSHLPYVYEVLPIKDELEEGQHADIGTLRSSSQYWVDIGLIKSEQKKVMDLPGRAKKSAVEYVKQRTAGPDVSEAKDHRPIQSYFLSKISMRRRNRLGMILSVGVLDVDVDKLFR